MLHKLITEMNKLINLTLCKDIVFKQHTLILVAPQSMQFDMIVMLIFNAPH